MAICKTCGSKYSKWTTPVSAKGACRECFEFELTGQSERRSREPAFSTPVASRLRNPNQGIHLRSFIPSTRSKIIFALVISCYFFTLSAFISTWARVTGIRNPPRSFYLSGDTGDVIGALIFAPVLESLVLVAIFELLRRLRAPDWVQVATSALFISEMHVWPWWPHAIIVLPAFLIQAAAYS
jgi:hypothetical protein